MPGPPRRVAAEILRLTCRMRLAICSMLGGIRARDLRERSPMLRLRLAGLFGGPPSLHLRDVDLFSVHPSTAIILHLNHHTHPASLLPSQRVSSHSLPHSLPSTYPVDRRALSHSQSLHGHDQYKPVENFIQSSVNPTDTLSTAIDHPYTSESPTSKAEALIHTVMVLFKRKAVFYLNNPSIQDEAEDIWVIPQTGEIFTTYESYLQRMDWYKSKRFTCEVSGRSGLSFFDALRSESAGSREVEQAFPDALKGPVLKRVQFSTTSRIDNLVDEVFDDFKADFYPGEIVTVVLDDSQRLNGRVREKAKFDEQRDREGNVVRKAFARYFVRLLDRPDEEALVDDDHMARDRKIFTKQMLRSFIKNCVTREAWNGAPWLVKSDIAERFRIDTAVPQHLQHGWKLAERKAARKMEQQNGMCFHLREDSANLSSPRSSTRLHPRAALRNATKQLPGISAGDTVRSFVGGTVMAPRSRRTLHLCWTTTTTPRRAIWLLRAERLSCSCATTSCDAQI